MDKIEVKQHKKPWKKKWEGKTRVVIMQLYKRKEQKLMTRFNEMGREKSFQCGALWACTLGTPPRTTTRAVYAGSRPGCTPLRKGKEGRASQS